MDAAHWCVRLSGPLDFVATSRMDRLPPLNAIRAFEAAARHLSVTLAADELSVTPGAVSRQIKSLESTLGLQLLKRSHRQIALTSYGSEYYRAITQALDALRNATRKLKRRSHRKQLKIRAYTTFAMRWLIPRLSSFHQAHPEIEVLLKASLEPVDFRKEDIDAAIRLGDGHWANANCYRLVSNVLAPVASPDLLASGPRLKRPADLAQHTLLHSIARLDDWMFWLESAGVDARFDARAGMTYESSAMSLRRRHRRPRGRDRPALPGRERSAQRPARAAVQAHAGPGRIHLLPAHAGSQAGVRQHDDLSPVAAGPIPAGVKRAQVASGPVERTAPTHSSIEKLSIRPRQNLG